MNELAHQQSPNGGLRELALFAGAGGGILGGKLLGWRTVCAVEIEPYAAAVLIQRQNDGILSPFPVWDDVRTFDGKPWRGRVDVVSGGFPCQDISAAGKGAGIEGERSGLWVEMARIIREVRPRFAFVENSPMLTSRGLNRVLGDLSEMGFDAEWGVIAAADVGAAHLRERIWIVADSESERTGHVCQNQWQTRREINPSDNPSRSIGRDDSSERETMVHATRIQQGRQIERPERKRTGSCGQSESMADSEYIGISERRGVDNAFEDDGQQRGIPSNESSSMQNQTGKTFPDTHIEHGDGTGPGTGPLSQLEASEVPGHIPNADINDVQRLEQKSQPGGHRRPNRLQDRAGSIPTGSWWQSEPDVGRVAHGVASRVDRLKAIGNGQVPICAAMAFRILAGTDQ